MKIIKKVDNLNFTIEFVPGKNSKWYGGKYEIEVKIPDDYPVEPPALKSKTKIYHPNIDVQGNVCLNFRKLWKPIDITVVIAQLAFVFDDPNPNDPLNLGINTFITTLLFK